MQDPRPWLVALLGVAAILAPCVGCGSGSTVQRLPLKGAVTIRGAQVQQGTISFLPSTPGGLPASTVITGGKYAFTTDNGPCAGPNRVVIGAAISRPGETDTPSRASQAATSTIAKASPSPTAPRRPSEAADEAGEDLQWEVDFTIPDEGVERKDFDLQ